MQQNIKTAIIGMGIMGQGIAEVFARAGHDVVVFDAQIQNCHLGLDQIKNRIDNQVIKNKISQEQALLILNRFSISENNDFSDFDLVVEVIVEQLEAKQNLFMLIEKTAKRECILCSNTSSLSINQIAEKLANPERFAGLHFFNPATLMQLVEVVCGVKTEAKTIETLREICRLAGKKTVVVADSPGFIVNRVARPYYTEALYALENTGLNITQADSLLEGLGFRMGPFRLMDLIGNDINLSVTTSLYEALGRPSKFCPSQTQQNKVKNKQLGRKTGQGFYEY